MAISRYTLSRYGFPAFGGVSQENGATPPQKGPVPPTFSALHVVRASSSLLKGVAVHRGIAATLSPVALQWVS